MQIFNAFRPTDTKVNEPRDWPWIYGDDFDGDLFGLSPRTMLSLSSIQQLHLQRWAAGEFISDWDPERKDPTRLEDVPLATSLRCSTVPLCISASPTRSILAAR